MNVLFSLLFVVVADGVGSGRLSMVIYRKAGLFLSSLQSDDDDDDDDSTEDDPLPELNSAIISATLASQSVTNLQDKVKLIFRPVKVSVVPSGSVSGVPSGSVWNLTVKEGT